MYTKYKVIAIGSSTGGPQALESILLKMPHDYPPILISQHMPVGYTKILSDRLKKITGLEVCEGKNGLIIKNGMVVIAPGGQHLELKQNSKGLYVRCDAGEKVNGHCPSVDVMFDSVALATGKNSIGIILTGMGADGSDGLLHMKDKGAFTIGQDEESSIVYGMPKVAFLKGAVTLQCSLDNIPQRVHSVLFNE